MICTMHTVEIHSSHIICKMCISETHLASAYDMTGDIHGLQEYTDTTPSWPVAPTCPSFTGPSWYILLLALENRLWGHGKDPEERRAGKPGEERKEGGKSTREELASDGHSAVLPKILIRVYLPSPLRPWHEQACAPSRS